MYQTADVLRVRKKFCDKYYLMADEIQRGLIPKEEFSVDYILLQDLHNPSISDELKQKIISKLIW